MFNPDDALHEATIDTKKAIELFKQFMEPTSVHRVLCLQGDGKMGKTHLLKKVFPFFARKMGAHCAILDLRNSMHDITDILHQACSQFPREYFNGYHAACEKRIKSQSPSVNFEDVRAYGSRIDVSVNSLHDKSSEWDLYLTEQFVDDLRKINTNILFLVDHIAKENVQAWLMDTLLTYLFSLNHQLDHVRVVVAGRSLPEPHGSYFHCYQKFMLKPVKDAKDYIPYCKHYEAKVGEEPIGEQTIQALTIISSFNPGLFVETLRAYDFITADLL